MAEASPSSHTMHDVGQEEETQEVKDQATGGQGHLVPRTGNSCRHASLVAVTVLGEFVNPRGSTLNG